MLPGFRSLVVAVVLATSMLIFGLGAAALLRATHEQFASLPLKPMPEATFGSKEAERPTLAVLKVDTPAAEPATPKSNGAEATHAEAPQTVTPLTDAQPENAPDAPATDALPATNTPGAQADTDGSTAFPPRSGSVPATADMRLPANTTASEQAPDGGRAGDAVTPPVARNDASSTDGKPSDVVETMTSPFGKRFKPPLPVDRPIQKTQVTEPATPATKRSAEKPPRVAKKHHHRRTIRQSRRSSQPVLSSPQLDLE